MRLISVDLPTFGKPTSATSARSLSSSRSHHSSPTSPCSAKAGARRRLDRKRALPRPPRPPSAATKRSPAATRSASTSPSRSRTTVPTGTFTTTSSPPAPWRRLPMPCVPSSARRNGWSLNASSEATLWSATRTTSPPLPPSPPSGPPLATWASRRNDTEPAPPSPALTCRLHSSTNWDTRASIAAPRSARRTEASSTNAGRPSDAPSAGPRTRHGPPRRAGRGRERWCAGSVGQDVDELAAPALAELHRAGRQGEQRVVAADADVLAGVEARAALADDDRAGVDGRAVEHLHPEALGLGVAAVLGEAGTLGLGHVGSPPQPFEMPVISIVE